jgi:hypothetical protein
VRSEENIRAGLKTAKDVAFTNAEAIIEALHREDYIRAYNLTHDLQVSCIAIASVTDACFGEDTKS